MRSEKIKTKSHAASINASTERHIAKVWDRACVIDIDAAMMIAEQHDQNIISDEQVATALLSMVLAGDYMNTYSQLYS